jgi:hypothetical protein
MGMKMHKIGDIIEDPPMLIIPNKIGNGKLEVGEK